ncbi:hypothetical protein GQ42DRAFT_163726, partial [Ramicandelaber brevisporus]
MQPARPIVPVGTHAGSAWGRLVSSPLLGSANSVSTLLVSSRLRAPVYSIKCSTVRLHRASCCSRMRARVLKDVLVEVAGVCSPRCVGWVKWA